MRPVHALLISLALPLFAQAPVSHPAVKILIDAARPLKGAPAIDTAHLSAALQTFAADHQLEQPAPDGDGWILGIGLTTWKHDRECLVATARLRLTRLQRGKLEGNPLESEVLVFAHESGPLNEALAHDLTHQGWDLLFKAHVIEKDPTADLGSIQAPVLDAKERILNVPFSRVQVSNQPTMPPYPADARENRVQGKVVLEVTTDAAGIPESASVVTGPGPLLAYAAAYLLKWRFQPMDAEGHPVRMRFWMNFVFHVG